ncbi:MAG: ABC transporter ATP-binding protein [bacterium]|nr:ABC transporter ATP-binding protein [bacterium]
MIRLSNISKTFRAHTVLDNLSLDIASDDRVALIGSNGAGKTTLIRCLMGQYVHEGLAEIDGISPRHERTKVLSDIGFVPQLPPPLKMPVFELIHFSAGVCNASPDHMIELTERMGLDYSEVKTKPFNRLSGGQKQKILVAIALGRETKLLILDEPTANLDPTARQILFELLSERIDRPILISSHRLEEVSSLVNRVIEMDRGRIVLDDRVSDMVDGAALQKSTLVLTRPNDAFAKAIGEWNFTSDATELQWKGEVAAPDRLRFLGTLSRYAGVLASVQIEAVQEVQKGKRQ